MKRAPERVPADTWESVYMMYRAARIGEECISKYTVRPRKNETEKYRCFIIT